MGQITAQGSSSDAEIVQASINLKETEQTRQLWPYLRDRRIDAYSNLDKRFIDEN